MTHPTELTPKLVKQNLFTQAPRLQAIGFLTFATLSKLLLCFCRYQRLLFHCISLILQLQCVSLLPDCEGKGNNYQHNLDISLRVCHMKKGFVYGTLLKKENTAQLPLILSGNLLMSFVCMGSGFRVCT